jgi:vacuolar-type H+-ATPase subunit F/Vma7
LRVVAIGRRAFVSAFRLAGIEGIEVSDKREMLEVIKQLIAKGDVGLILLAQDLSKDIRVELANIRKRHPVPLIYELPAPGSRPEQIDYMQLVKEIVGV